MPEINDVIHVRQDGTEVTVLDRAIETLRLGGFITDAAARTGVSEATMHRWLRTGTRASADLLAGNRTQGDLTVHERDCLRFAAASAEAEAEGKVLLLGLLRQSAQGGRRIEKVTVTETGGRPAIYRDNGSEYLPEIPPSVTTSTVTETTLPSERSLTWMLEHRWPDQFGRVNRLEVTGADGGPVELAVSEVSAMEGLLSRLEQMAQAQAIETTTADEIEDGQPGIDHDPPTELADTPPALEA